MDTALAISEPGQADRVAQVFIIIQILDICLFLQSISIIIISDCYNHDCPKKWKVECWY